MTAMTNRIRPHLWFDTEAREAAGFYVETFPASRITNITTIHDTPSGDSEIVSFELLGQGFMAISAGPLFKFTPAVSFQVSCSTRDEVDQLWARLAAGGQALMPLDSYPFSDRFGWTSDRYGLSWQVMLTREPEISQRITPTLMFVGDVCGRAQEAVDFYASIFPASAVGGMMRYGPGEEPDRAGTVKHCDFTLGGQRFAAMDSAGSHDFTFNEAISFLVDCADQAEIDRYWDALSAVPEAEQCGWLKDRFGLTWQIVPTAMEDMMTNGSPEQIARVTQAFLKMKKFDLAALQSAYTGA
ncbi:MAG: VOC family protein [Chloroflexi bacterium]|nr:MAG: VOC family protein [Chloroflexota bacterium]